MKVIERRADIERLGAEVLLIAYDEPSLLRAKILRGLDVSFPLLLDMKKQAYARWGMGRARLTDAMLSARLTWRYFKLLARREVSFFGFAPDMLQLGGDFVIDRAGVMVFAHRMRDNGDRAEVDTLLEALERG